MNVELPSNMYLYHALLLEPCSSHGNVYVIASETVTVSPSRKLYSSSSLPRRFLSSLFFARREWLCLALSETEMEHLYYKQQQIALHAKNTNISGFFL